MVAIALDQPLCQKTVAAPGYLAGKDIPVHPRDLLHHACINWRQGGMEGTYKWEYEKQGHFLAVAVKGPLIVNDRAAGLNAAVQGIGITMSAELRVGELIRAGQLVELLQDWTPDFAGFHLHYPRQRSMLAGTRAFIDFVSGRSV